MGGLIVLLVGLVEVAAIAGGLFLFAQRSQSGGGSSVLETLETERAQRKDLVAKIEGMYREMTPIPAFRDAIKELKEAQEALRTERGRITITQAELETVETRLRELEEIERELEASGLETKEELNILEKKEAELKNKNDALKGQISESVSELEAMFSKIEMSAQLQEQVQGMKTQLIQTEQSVEMLLLQLSEGNDQYFIMKRRYDALDIEYAQLYEKFSETEAASGGGGGGG